MNQIENLALVPGEIAVVGVFVSQSHDELVGRDFLDADHSARGQIDERRANREPRHLAAIDQEVGNRGRFRSEVARFRAGRRELRKAGRPADGEDHEPQRGRGERGDQHIE